MSDAPEGLLASLRGFATTAAGLLRTRLELFRLEVREEAGRIAGLYLWGFAAVLCAVVGVVFFAIFVTVLFWDSHRLLVLGIFSLLFFAVAGVAVAAALRLSRQGSRMFSASLAELQRDEAALDTSLTPARNQGQDTRP
ncbi:MAG: phage holin family protein [Rhodocyclaceae bacterium]|nr:phage holin family protein [Rhodocyclaceae bacterium]MDP1956869.1 phage holin family protein [Rhodocyclaceae bacterium]